VKKELVEGQKATKRKLEEAGWTDTGTKFADLSIFKKKENEKNHMLLWDSAKKEVYRIYKNI